MSQDMRISNVNNVEKMTVPFRFVGRNHKRAPRSATALLLLVSITLACTLVQAAQDVMLVLDNSGSMKKNDPEFLARNAVREFIESLDTDTRAGVVIFDQRVTLAVPLTEINEPNKRLLTNSLDDINYRGQLTDSPAAVERAIYELKTKARDGANKYIVFMTDGIVDTGNAAADVEKTKWLREELAVDAADNGIKVLSVAFTENADFFLIQSLAKKTGGDYFRALTAADLSGVFAEMGARIAQTPIAETGATPSVATPPTLVDEPQPSVEPDSITETVTPEAPVTEPVAEQPLEEVTTVPEQTTAGTADSSDILANISAEDLEALREISEIEGIPIEQLARELYGSGDETEVSPGVVITRPGEPTVVVAEDDPSIMALLIAAAVLLLLLVLLVVWLVRRKKSKGGPGDESTSEAVVSAPSQTAPAAFLHDISGLAAEPLVNLDDKPLMVGRIAGAPDEHLRYLVVNAPTVGRRHAVIKFKDRAYWLVDQGSVNGTYVNDNRLSGETQLRHGDRVRFHNAEFEFTQPDVADAGETMIGTAVIGGDATIVADAATMAGVASAAVAVSASDDAPADDLFDVPPQGDEQDLTLDGSDSDEYIAELEAGQDNQDGQDQSVADHEATPQQEASPDTSIDDIFDVTGEDAVPAVAEHDSDDDEASEDVTELNPDATAVISDDMLPTPDDEVLDITQMPDDKAVAAAAVVAESPDAEIDHEFDAEASAFFDDITVGPVVDNDGDPVTSTPQNNMGSGDDLFDDSGDSGGDSAEPSQVAAHDEQAELDAKLEKARQLAEAEGDSASPPTEHVDVAHMETMLNMEAPPPEDPNDLTLDDFIETSNFQAPKTATPDTNVGADDFDATSDDVSLSQFVDTGTFESGQAAETMILDESESASASPPDKRDDAEEDSDQDVDSDDDGSEDPTTFK